MHNVKIPFKNLEDKIIHIRDTFFQEYYESSPIPKPIDSIIPSLNNSSRIYSYSESVIIAFNKLNPLDQTFINNEFFYQEHEGWWKKIYSKSSFYRLKRHAMEEFISAYEN